jgi:lipoate-protein ligase A
MRGRFLDCTLGNPFLNLALEEALFRSLVTPVLRVWDNQRSVVIGRAQLASIEADVEACRARSVPIVRRFTAGGAVYNGPGNVNWSFLVPRGPMVGGGQVFDPKGVFVAFAESVVRALESCSSHCRFEPPNRIVNDWGKVSGMAAYISSEGVICHGTMLLNADLEEVQALARPAAGGVDGRYPRSAYMKVSNCGVGRKEFTEALARSVGAGYAPGSPRDYEMALATRLASEKYTQDAWNLGDPFRSDNP